MAIGDPGHGDGPKDRDQGTRSIGLLRGMEDALRIFHVGQTPLVLRPEGEMVTHRLLQDRTPAEVDLGFSIGMRQGLRFGTGHKGHQATKAFERRVKGRILPEQGGLERRHRRGRSSLFSRRRLRGSGGRRRDRVGATTVG